MSGDTLKGGGIGTIIGATIGTAIAPGIGTALGAAAGGATGDVGGTVVGMNSAANQAKKSAAAQQDAFNASLKKLQPIPSIDSTAAQQAKLQSLFDLQNRSGRASTLLTTATTNKFGG